MAGKPKNTSKNTAQDTKIEQPVVDHAAMAQAFIDRAEILANPSTLVFPTDKWGLCKDLKKDMLYLAGRLYGSEDKYNLYMQTLYILMAHVEAKYLKDKALKEKKESNAEVATEE